MGGCDTCDMCRCDGCLATDDESDGDIDDVTVCDYESDGEDSFISYEVDCGCQAEEEEEDDDGLMVEEPDACAYSEPCQPEECDPFDNGVENGDRFAGEDPLTVRPSEYESPFAADPEVPEPPPEDLPKEVEVVLADGDDPSKVEEREVPDAFKDLDNEVHVVGSQEFGMVEVTEGADFQEFLESVSDSPPRASRKKKDRSGDGDEPDPEPKRPKYDEARYDTGDGDVIIVEEEIPEEDNGDLDGVMDTIAEGDEDEDEEVGGWDDDLNLGGDGWTLGENKYSYVIGS
jgi:hypothetical protein